MCCQPKKNLQIIFKISYAKKAFHSSSAVEQLAVNQLVAGSIPACGACFSSLLLCRNILIVYEFIIYSIINTHNDCKYSFQLIG